MLIEKVLAGEVTQQQAIDELGGETIDPQMEEKFRALTAKALADASPELAGASRLRGAGR